MALLVAAPLAATWSVAPATAVATCQGQEATITGAPGQPITGTEGPDVVVTNGATTVATLGDDDTVCVTRESAKVAAGAGDDTVLAQLTGAPELSRFVIADLGAGEDAYVGWAGRDTVQGSDGEGDDTETDDISTLGGRDVVTVGARDTQLADAVDLGPGPGTLNVRSSSAADGVVLRGGGVGTLNLGTYGGWWLIQNKPGTAEQGGELRFRFTGFTTFYDVGESLTFVGSGADETLVSRVPTNAIMGQGDDSVSLTRVQAEVELGGGRVAGGAGRDQVFLSTAQLDAANPRDGYVYVNLPERWARLDGRSRVGLDGWETVRFATTDVARYVGTSRADVVEARACDLGVATHGGDDRVTLLQDAFDREDWSCPRPRARLVRTGGGDDVVNGTAGTLPDTVEGGPGDDVLRGYSGDDRLYGGTGRDVTDGGAGRDLCRGEVRRACER